MAAEKVLELINKRYTVKSFKETLVPEHITEKLLAAALDAPSKQNKYPYRIYVLDNRSENGRKMREKLVRYTSCHIDLAGYESTFLQNEIRTAPLSFLLTMKPVEEDWESGQFHERAASIRSVRDAMMPTIFMLLQAQEFDLGTACTGCFENGIKNIDQFREDFGLDEDEFPCIVLNVGYADDVTDMAPTEAIPRRIDENGNLSYAQELQYVDPSDPSQGVFAAYNRGISKKKQPKGFLKVF